MSGEVHSFDNKSSKKPLTSGPERFGTIDDLLRERMTRRRALSTAGMAVAAVAGIVVVGGVAYYIGTSTATPSTTTATSTATSTATTTATSTATSTETSVATTTATSTATSISTSTATSTATETSTLTTSASQTAIPIKLLTQHRPQVDALLKLATAQSANAIGVKAVADQLDFSQMAPTLTAMVAGGNIPYDLISMAHDQLGPYVPYLRSLDDLVETNSVDLSVFVDALVQQLYKRDKANGRFGQGNLLGIPYLTDPWGIQYNTKLYTDAGLVDSKGNPTPPSDWNKFVEYMGALTKAPNQYGMAASFGVWWNPAWMHASWVASNGGAVLDKDYRPLINDSINVQAVQFWADALNTHNFLEPTALSTDDAGLIGAYNAGKVANIIYWFSSTIPSANDPSSSTVVGQTAAAALPGSSGQYAGKAPAGGWAHEVPGQSKNPDAAFRYAIFETSLEAQASLTSGETAFVRKASFTDPQVVAKFPYISSIATIQNNAYAEPSFEIQQGSQLWTIYLKYFQAAIAGNQSAQAAMDACFSDWDALLKTAGYYS